MQPEELADAARAMVRARAGALCACALIIGARSDPRMSEISSSAVVGNSCTPANEEGAESIGAKRKTGYPRDFNSAIAAGVKPSKSVARIIVALSTASLLQS